MIFTATAEGLMDIGERRVRCALGPAGVIPAAHKREGDGASPSGVWRIRQVLYNLISNALKFTEQGEIRVSATYVDGELSVSVRDTGPGIAPENLPRLFEKFDQLDSSTTRRFGGTGLGLAICRELAQLMDGQMSVESDLGLGSRFDLRTGEPTGLPATEPVATFPVEIRDGDIYVSTTPKNGVMP